MRSCRSRIRETRGGRRALAIVAACALAACATAGRDREVVSVPLLAARINAGQTGMASLVGLADGHTEVAVTISGVPNQLVSRPVHLYTFVYEEPCGEPPVHLRYALTARVLAGSPSSNAIAPLHGPFTITNVAPVDLAALRRGSPSLRIYTAPADGNREIFCANLGLPSSTALPPSSDGTAASAPVRLARALPPSASR